MGAADTASAPSLHRATPQEAAACYDILRGYAEGVDRTLGTVSWTHPRTEALVHADAAAGRLYVVRQNGALAATFAILSEGAPRFSAVRWAEPGSRAAYLTGSRWWRHSAERDSGNGAWRRVSGSRPRRGTTI